MRGRRKPPPPTYAPEQNNTTEIKLLSILTEFYCATLAMLSEVLIGLCYVNSVCLPPVTRVYCIKTAEHVSEILSLSDRAIILVLRHQELLRKSEGFTPNGGAKYKGVAIFDKYAAISPKR